ncbi:hypothetical protein GCM10009785_33130 [Brooklawnia cerclae]|uniref:PBP domain-containing protein n=1 Tax=Brooklawnia cerclae TaxID=349934 RepID=A0ABX0SCS5_9ACTN|nr:hypothetical protein [Brooklawnia cerclae]NIH55771.1 hypothetical protein [Brooklawnia cerclae]
MQLRQGSTGALLLVIGILIIGAQGIGSAQAEEPTDGPVSSAVTVKAADYDADAVDAPFPDLEVTVSQTEDLQDQGITVSWTGGEKSTRQTSDTNGGTNFLQIVQCWGDEPGSNGTRPDRTTCVYGGINSTGAQRNTIRSATELANIPEQDEAYTYRSQTWTDASRTAIPFRSATDKTVANILDGKPLSSGDERYGNLSTNEFYTKYTTNEVPWAGSGADGSGSVSFELQTVEQSPGLGCGTPVTGADGTVSGTSCWLVVIPRGTSDPLDPNLTNRRSGLFWETWQHHVAIKLDFKPVGLSCVIGASERLISGSELLGEAVGQWQPTLCSGENGAVYSLLTGPESDAALAANGTSPAPLALTTRALAVDDVTDNLAYAPIALTGISVAFAVDRYYGANEISEEQRAREGRALESMRLNPRLLAKLLTASYIAALPSNSDKSHLSSNPNTIVYDPEFLELNPEWTNLALNGVGVSDILVTLGRSDSAQVVWEYILSNPDAVDFLNGVPDPWGTIVNPYYSTNPQINPTGTGLTLPRDDFPKADPTEFSGYANNNYADVVNLVTWRPYTSSLTNAAYLVLRGDGQGLGKWDPQSVPPKYGKSDRDLPGYQQVIGLTDSSAAERYQVVQASLLNPAGEYVAPTTVSLQAAAAAMTADSEQQQVVGFDQDSAPAAAAKGAYPLAVPIYAAANPAMTDVNTRADYASFITYAATDGQQEGTDDGELPAGYAPIPDEWRTQALAAAEAIRSGGWPTVVSPPSGNGTQPTTTAPGTGQRSSSSVPVATAPVTVPAQSDASQPGSGAGNPAASGAPSGAVTGAPTPDDPSIGALVAAVPAVGGVAMAAAIGAPVVTRIRRSPRAGPP